MSGRRSKIICTLGPVSSSPDAILALVDAGMDVARLNLSHGTLAEHAATYAGVRAASEASGKAIGVLVDLQGPKIRLGSFEGGVAVLVPGSVFTVRTQPGQGTSQGASVSYEALARELLPGDTLLIDDGLIKLSAVSSDGREVSCRVVEGGPLSDHKGVNLPGTRMGTPALTEKDVEDLTFALELGVDMVALSFVRQAGDAAAARYVMDSLGKSVPLIAKIEKPEAVTDIDAIVDTFDGLMVARGDLAIEVSPEQVPLIQKDVVQLARERGKPVIVATQMLESMIHHSRPTRAEASDVANAVLDGADALMLAGETSVGGYAVEAVATVSRIAAAAEDRALSRIPALGRPMTSPEEAIAAAAVRVGATVDARALVAFTRTGMTAQRLASHRSPIPVLAFTSEPAVRNQLALTWGVDTSVAAVARDSHEEVAQMNEAMLRSGRGRPGDRVVMVAGEPGRTGSTSTLRVHELSSGQSDARASR
ncbi:MAG TPA: pyruvate kinase [Acidimicrobiales bacterium]|nr:pyruvate kinase [Acidimicrobiales bacterium]